MTAPGVAAAPRVWDEFGCEICAAIQDASSAFVVAGTTSSMCLVPERSRTWGSVLIVPRRHVCDMLGLRPDEAADLLKLARDACRAIATLSHADGMHLSWDSGAIANQYYPHLSVEVVPRHIDDGYDFTPTAQVVAMAMAERENAARGLRELMIKASGSVLAAAPP